MWPYIILAFIWLFQYLVWFNDIFVQLGWTKARYTLSIEDPHDEYEPFNIESVILFLDYKYSNKFAAGFNMIWLNLIGIVAAKIIKSDARFIYKVKQL